MNMWTKKLALGVIGSMFSVGVVLAQTSSSTQYSINEYFIGPGGETDLNSASYSARATLGDLGTGNFNSTNYQLYGGFTTTTDPYIELVVNSTNIDMGVLDTATTGTGTATFSVRTYLADSYTVTAGGTLPTNESGGTIAPIDPKAGSVQGTEQFGFNLWTNTATGDYGAFGALPVQVPDSGFSFGTVDDEYNDDGQFKYAATDAVAGYAGSSGQTDYTASYIFNVGPLTEAGYYIAQQTFVATSTF